MLLSLVVFFQNNHSNYFQITDQKNLRVGFFENNKTCHYMGETSRSKVFGKADSPFEFGAGEEMYFVSYLLL